MLSAFVFGEKMIYCVNDYSTASTDIRHALYAAIDKCATFTGCVLEGLPYLITLGLALCYIVV